ncbi:hypothetical protein JB92DRAFT_3292918 [Gautieria morchelliformis]|nr:hypothetical protein JB92DRAFT_3292918 [Gautieria morchelliformis]
MLNKRKNGGVGMRSRSMVAAFDDRDADRMNDVVMWAGCGCNASEHMVGAAKAIEQVTRRPGDASMSQPCIKFGGGGDAQARERLQRGVFEKFAVGNTGCPERGPGGRYGLRSTQPPTRSRRTPRCPWAHSMLAHGSAHAHASELRRAPARAALRAFASPLPAPRLSSVGTTAAPLALSARQDGQPPSRVKDRLHWDAMHSRGARIL